MAYVTNEAYYDDPSLHGSYQYVPLSELVESFMISRVGPDKEVDNVKRHEVLFHAKRGIQELSYDASTNANVLETQVDDSLRVVMPPDFVDYIKISINVNGKLVEIYHSNKSLSATKYQQNPDYTYIFDGSGNVVTEQSLLDYTRINTPTITSSGSYSWCVDDVYLYAFPSTFYNADIVNMDTMPTFDLDKKNGVINFASTAVGQLVVIEYTSDGMKNGDDSLVAIHKHAEEFLYAYIKWAILNEKHSVPEYIKKRNTNQKVALWYNTRIRLQDNGTRLIRTLRNQSKRF